MYPTIPECPHSSTDGTSYQGAHGSTKASTWFKEELHKAAFPRKLFGKAPWRRKESGDSLSSVSSSVREVLRGYTPPATPFLELTASRMLSKELNGSFRDANRVSSSPFICSIPWWRTYFERIWCSYSQNRANTSQRRLYESKPRRYAKILRTVARADSSPR